MPNILRELKSQDFFKLPFDEKPFILTLGTLDRYTAFKLPKKLRIKTRKISFVNEILTLGVNLNEEEEELVYLKITYEALLVRCTVDTCETYLSFTAYCVLINLMSIYNFIDFHKYYWPDFFDEKDGTSKYLDIINDRQGLDVTLKSPYKYLFKPHDFLLLTDITEKFSVGVKPSDILDNNGVGFCIVDCHLMSWHSLHFPLLMPLKGILTLDKTHIKSFIGFTYSDGSNPAWSSHQNQASKVCIEMLKDACFYSHERKNPHYTAKELNEETISKFSQMFSLWHEVYPIIINLPNSFHYETVGFNTVRIVPRTNRMKPCKFLYSEPKIFFQWQQFEEHFELTYMFEVDGMVYAPFKKNTAFFINSENEPLSFYLLRSVSDALITFFFAEREFKIQILKVHYPHFEPYWNWLRSNFNVEYL